MVKRTSDVEKAQLKSIDDLWKFILVENETIVPYVHCLNQLQTIEPIEGINVEEALFVFLNISSDIVRHNDLTAQREYRRSDIMTAYSNISSEDKAVYHEDAINVGNVLKFGLNYLETLLKYFLWLSVMN